MDKNKKVKILILSSVAVLVILISSFTYAFFRSESANKDFGIDVITGMPEQLLFNVGNGLSIYANQDNFAPGSGNKVTSNTATVTLLPKRGTNGVSEATSYNYYVYLYIDDNPFIYTSAEKKPELLLKITDPDNNPITEIEGLNYNEEYEGFDVTESGGLFTIAEDYEIAAENATTIQNWNFELTLFNLNSDQQENALKGFTANVSLQIQEVVESLSEVCESGDKLSDCLIRLGTFGATNVTGLYHHDEGLVNGAGDNSYRYSGGGYYLSQDIIGKYNRLKSATFGDTKGLIAFYCNGTVNPIYYYGTYCSEAYESYFLLRSDNSHYDTYDEAFEAAINANLVTEKTIDNFVCFGSDETDCPSDNLYRIIGVFDNKVKLIKWDYANSDLMGDDGSIDPDDSGLSLEDWGWENCYKGDHDTLDFYFWNDSGWETGGYDWPNTVFNKVNLNEHFLENLGDWANKIATTTWYYSGLTEEQAIYTNAATSYRYEIGKDKIPVEDRPPYDAKIGLMYVSDWNFATDKRFWKFPNSIFRNIDGCYGCSVGYEAQTQNNWMYMGAWETLLTISSDNSDDPEYGYGYLITEEGEINLWDIASYTSTVRPVFNLLENVTFVSGTGTKTDPIRIN